MLAVALLACAVQLGCGSGISASSGGANDAALSVSPSSGSIEIGSHVTVVATGSALSGDCVWSSSDPTILSPDGNGDFLGISAGTASAAVSCGKSTTAAAFSVTHVVPSAPIVITKGGSYTGSWASTNPSTPAITIRTDELVTIHDSLLTSKSDLIRVIGTNGANVILTNVTGTAVDPGVAGQQRGNFLAASKVATLSVTNCTMIGGSFGVHVSESTLTSLKISKNIGQNLEDRASDGHGGLTSTRPALGHFIYIGNSTAPNGGEISWNSNTQSTPNTSVEDVFIVYRSQGASGAPLWLHDNLADGAFSFGTSTYSGSGFMVDGSATAPVSAYVLFQNNQVIHTANVGFGISNGHDVTFTNNRVVSCGQDATGAFYSTTYAQGFIVWNFYTAPSFYNLTVQGSSGGSIRPSSTTQPMIADIWSTGLGDTDILTNNKFDDPCLVQGAVNITAESAERAAWQAKVLKAGVAIGDQSSH